MPQQSKFGGVPVKDSDLSPGAPRSKFGGVAVDPSSVPQSKFGGVAVTEDLDAPKPLSDEEAHQAAMKAAFPNAVSVPMKGRDGQVTDKGTAVPMGKTAEAITAPVRFVAEGAEQTGRGREQMRNSPVGSSQWTGGLSDTVRGAGSMLLPMAAPAIAAHPVAAATGMAVGTVTGKTAEALSNAVGVPSGYSQAIGDVAGGYAGTKLGGKIGPAIEGKVSDIYGRYVGDPVALAFQALRPTAKNFQFKDAVKLAMPELKAEEAARGKPVDGLRDFLDLAKSAKKRLWDQYLNVAGPQAQRGISLAPVADAIEKSIPEMLKFERPAEARAIQRLADRYRTQYATMEQAERMLGENNARLDHFYAKNPTARATARKGNVSIGVRENKGDALRDVIYKALDDAQDGFGIRDLKKRYGSIMNMEREGYRRVNVAERQQSENLLSGAGLVSGAGDVAMGAAKIFRDPVGGAADILSGGAKAAAARAIKNAQTSDALIRRSFKNWTEAPAPLSLPPQFRPAGLLPGADVVTGPAGASRPTGRPNPNRTPGGSEQHQTGGTLYTEPPDLSRPEFGSVTARQGMAAPPFQRRALPPGGAGPVTAGPPGMSPEQLVRENPNLRGGVGVTQPDTSSTRVTPVMRQPQNMRRALGPGDVTVPPSPIPSRSQPPPAGVAPSRQGVPTDASGARVTSGPSPYATSGPPPPTAPPPGSRRPPPVQPPFAVERTRPPEPGKPAPAEPIIQTATPEERRMNRR